MLKLYLKESRSNILYEIVQLYKNIDYFDDIDKIETLYAEYYNNGNIKGDYVKNGKSNTLIGEVIRAFEHIRTALFNDGVYYHNDYFGDTKSAYNFLFDILKDYGIDTIKRYIQKITDKDCEEYDRNKIDDISSEDVYLHYLIYSIAPIILKWIEVTEDRPNTVDCLTDF